MVSIVCILNAEKKSPSENTKKTFNKIKNLFYFTNPRKTERTGFLFFMCIITMLGLWSEGTFFFAVTTSSCNTDRTNTASCNINRTNTFC